MIPRVLVVDDDTAVRFTVRSVLEDAGLDVIEATDGRDALRRLDSEGPVHVVVTDLRMPGMDGMALLDALRLRPSAPRAVVITAHGDEREAVRAMKKGAWDYFRKPFDIDELAAVVGRAAEAARLDAEARRLQSDVTRLQSELHLARHLVYQSAPMARLAGLVQRVARRDVTVLIVGESGTGKEHVADAIVQGSGRANRPFVRFNCASLGGELAEAELFGHSKGAFTGATRARAGLFREADGGTLLLDEVGELDPVVQARLLRVLQQGEVRPVGEERPVKVDVRVLAATHRDLAALSAQGAFREDLRYRLDVVRLQVPPLRDRTDDIPLLARHFLRLATERFGVPMPTPHADWTAGLVTRPWPGNVRELKNAVEMLVALSDEGTLDLSLLDAQAPTDPVGTTLRARMEAVERGLILQALQAANGNKAAAARALGVGRVTLYEKLARYGLKDAPTG